MITETISQRFNASIIIREKLPQIIEAFVSFYGEEERDYIEDKFKKVFIVSYGSPKSYERIIEKNDKKVKDYLEEKLLADLKIPRNLKHRFLESLFGEFEIFNNETPIEEYIKYLNNDISEISYSKIKKLLNYFGKNTNADVLIKYIKKGGYEELNKVVETYQKIKEEYHKYLESTKVYRDYIVRCQDLYSKLETKYLKKYIDEIKDIFTNEEFQELENFLNKKMSYDDLTPRIKNYIGTNPLNSPPLVESFSGESEIIIQKDDSWQKRSIIQDRITYFKNLGINLGENYQRYQMNKEAKLATPTEELVNHLKIGRESIRNELMTEYYESLPEYVKYRQEITSLNLLDREDDFNSRAYHRNATFTCPNLVYDGTNYHLKQLLFISMGSREEYLDNILIHEFNHIYEIVLKEVTPSNYLCIGGWEVLEGEITKNYDSSKPIDHQRNFRSYELFNEIINELLSQEICASMHQNSNYILNTPKESKITDGTTYELALFLVNDFYQKYKKAIIASRKNGNIDIIYNEVGKENFEALNSLIVKFKSKFNRTKYEYTKSYIEMGWETEDTKELKKIIKIRDDILENMQKYQTRRTK